MLHEDITCTFYNDRIIFTPTSLSQLPNGFKEPSLVLDRISGLISFAASNGSSGSSVGRKKASKVLQVCAILGVLTLQAGKYILLATGRQLVGTIDGHRIYRISKVNIEPYNPKAINLLGEKEKKAESTYIKLIDNLLNDKDFYFSYTYDLTHSMQAQSSMKNVENVPLHERAAARFFWNKTLLEEFKHMPLDKWILPIIRGYFESSILLIEGIAVDFILVSRRSRHRAGTRYLTRGANEYGEVANYVETEQIVGTKGVWTAFVQTRGSVPLFWGQNATSFKYHPQAQLTHSVAETEKAFANHFNDQIKRYKKQLVVNLLDRKGHELNLSKAFERYISTFPARSQIDYVSFDFHAFCRNNQFDNVNILVEQVADRLAAMLFFKLQTGKIMHKQIGIIRTNCLDCLDRTNLVQSTFGYEAFVKQVQSFGLNLDFEDNELISLTFKEIWANNGDAISMQYAGTGALKSDFTRTGKRKTKGKMKDGVNSISRFVINTFWDGYRQVAIDLVTGMQKIEAIDLQMLKQEELRSTETRPDSTFTLDFDSEQPK